MAQISVLLFSVIGLNIAYTKSEHIPSSAKLKKLKIDEIKVLPPKNVDHSKYSIAVIVKNGENKVIILFTIPNTIFRFAFFVLLSIYINYPLTSKRSFNILKQLSF